MVPLIRNRLLCMMIEECNREVIVRSRISRILVSKGKSIFCICFLENSHVSLVHLLTVVYLKIKYHLRHLLAIDQR